MVTRRLWRGWSGCILGASTTTEYWLLLSTLAAVKDALAAVEDVLVAVGGGVGGYISCGGGPCNGCC